MNDQPGPAVIDRFKERVAQRRWDGVRVTYRVAGGMPSEGRRDEEVSIAGQAVTARDNAGARERSEGQMALDDARMAELLGQLGADLDTMVPASKARFLPDSVVGVVTVEVDGETVTRYFLADEEERRFRSGTSLAAGGDAVSRFAGLAQQLLGKEVR